MSTSDKIEYVTYWNIKSKPEWHECKPKQIIKLRKIIFSCPVIFHGYYQAAGLWLAQKPITVDKLGSDFSFGSVVQPPQSVGFLLSLPESRTIIVTIEALALR